MPVYHPNDWRLFLDTSKHSLKCALFHNGKVYSAVPIGHFVYLRKEHNDIKTMIDLLRYHEHNWTICVDLKMVNFLLGQQGRLTKCSGYLCICDSRAREKHWNQKEWPIREALIAGMPYIVKDPVVSREKIIFPPLHIKLGLMKQFVKVLITDDECFQHIFAMLPDLSFEKIMAGIFNGPKVRVHVHNQEFSRKMNIKERTAGFHLWR